MFHLAMRMLSSSATPAFNKFPSVPPFGSLRLASLADIPRLAAVATAGFYYSPVFTWERRFHAKFPVDTFLSYQKMFADIITSQEYIALVATDAYDPNEDSKTDAIIQPDVPSQAFPPGKPVIVGVATWKLQPGSSRSGQFLTPGPAPPNLRLDGGLGRDKSAYHASLLDNACDTAEERYFEGHQIMDMVVVHPAYWSRGHGSHLVEWGIALADLDQVKQGVIAASIGEKLYLKLNFTKLDEVAVQDKASPPSSVKVGVLRYSPRSTIRISREEL